MSAVHTVLPRLTLRNDLAELSLLPPWLERVYFEWHAGERDRFRVELVLIEIVTNILTHGFRQGGTGEIVIAAEIVDATLRVVVNDSGPAFDPLSAPAKPLPERLEDATPGGLGLVLVRGFVDESQYSRDAERNRLTLTFKRTVPAPPPS